MQFSYALVFPCLFLFVCLFSFFKKFLKVLLKVQGSKWLILYPYRWGGRVRPPSRRRRELSLIVLWIWSDISVWQRETSPADGAHICGLALSHQRLAALLSILFSESWTYKNALSHTVSCSLSPALYWLCGCRRVSFIPPLWVGMHVCGALIQSVLSNFKVGISVTVLSTAIGIKKTLGICRAVGEQCNWNGSSSRFCFFQGVLRSRTQQCHHFTNRAVWVTKCNLLYCQSKVAQLHKESFFVCFLPTLELQALLRSFWSWSQKSACLITTKLISGFLCQTQAAAPGLCPQSNQ